jgi:hypothetical protein
VGIRYTILVLFPDARKLLLPSRYRPVQVSTILSFSENWYSEKRVRAGVPLTPGLSAHSNAFRESGSYKLEADGTVLQYSFV